MVGCVGSDHTTPECRVKLVLTENPDIIFTDLHSSLGGKSSREEGAGESPATISIISVRLLAASTELLSSEELIFLKCYRVGVK